MLINLFWFLGGALIYKFLSYIFNLGSTAKFFNETAAASILLLKSVDNEKIIILDKYLKTLEEEGRPQEEINKIKNTTLHKHALWRELVIENIIMHCPRSLRGTINFNNWDTAMRLVKKIGA